MSMDKVLAKKKGLRAKHIPFVVGGVLILVLVYQVVFAEHKSVFRTDKDKLSISVVEEGLFNDYISVIGKVEPISTIYLDAVEGGRVVERIIDEGAMLKAGDVILKLENNQLYQTILNSEAALAEKENYLRNTRISFETEMIQSQKNMLDNEYNLVRKKRTYIQSQKLIDEELISTEAFLQSKEDYDYQVQLLTINKLKARNDSLIRLT